MLKCVKITSFFFVLLFELLPDTTSTVSGDCDFLRSCVNYKYREKKKKKRRISKRCLQEKTCQIFRKTSISYPLIRTCTCVFHGVRNVSFSEDMTCFVSL